MEATNMTAVDKIDSFINRNEDMIYRIGILFSFIFLGIVIPAHHLIQAREQLLQSQLMHQQYVDEKNIEVHDLNLRIEDISAKYQKTESFKKEVTCLAENVYYEAGTQGKDGMLAVAQVTLNRKKAGFAPSICGVVHQRNEIGCQFSWVCEPYKEPIPSLFNRAYEVARKSLLTGVAMAKLNSALYFHGDYINPDWSSKKFITQIGQHKFYGEKSNGD
jgi:spore germination cell wall hydrolase CwlJ-like protein